VDPGTGALFYLSNATSTFGSVGISSNWNGTKQKQLFSSAIAGWLPQFWRGSIVLTQTPADDLPGYAYTLSTTGQLTPLLGPVAGLEVLPDPYQNALLFSASAGGSLSLFAQIGTKPPARIALSTIAEKCVWAPGQSLIVYCAVPNSLPSAQFLNDWLRGLVHTNDSWWQIDVSSGTATELYAMPGALDVQKPTIDPSGNFIAFVNGADQSLWMLRVNQ
ncbi:MAG TPA: hypothetical protein VN495_03590, partial [Candidatus Paceibacterota bacterium]|nr:hypothetical protein [Candidatus Paceibacterota bacterium]